MTDSIHGKTAGRVLVADDEPLNREGLQCLLELEGHSVITAADGRAALDAARRERPDVVILDVCMPRMDGFEACRRIKEDPATSHIPVLLVTGLQDRGSRIRGVAAGADEFLSKPPDEEELKVRVRNAVFLKHLFDRLRENYERLKQLEDLRDSLTHMIVHDLRAPAAAAQGYLEIFQDSLGGKDLGKMGACVPKASACIARLLDMINAVLDVSRLEARQMKLSLSPLDLRAVVRKGVDMAGAATKNIEVRERFPSRSVEVEADAEVIRRVITNLVGNAVKFTPTGGTVTVSLGEAGGQAWVEVADTGPGIPPEHHHRIFEKFGQVHSRQVGAVASSGLGLTFCKLAMEAHGGCVGVSSEEEKGSTFRIEFPCRPAAADGRAVGS